MLQQIKNLSKRTKIIMIAAGVLILLFLTVYLVGRNYYKKHFLPSTWINGMDCSGETLDEATADIQNSVNSYVLSIEARNSQGAQIAGTDIELTYVDDGSVGRILNAQNENTWITSAFGKKDFSVNEDLSYNETILQTIVSKISFLQAENMIAPQDAFVQDDGTAFVVAAEVEGTTLDVAAVYNTIVEYIKAEKPVLNLDEAGLYAQPAIRQTEPSLQADADQLNEYTQANIVYDFVDRQYVVDRNVIRSFLAKDDAGNYSLNTDLVYQWVYNMAWDTDTFANSHQFTTHNGETITLASGGDYGWAIDKEETTAALIQAIQNKYVGNLDPSYLYEANDRSTNDIGGTYVEVCISEQMLYCYQDGQLVVSTPVITGNHSTGYDTPSGSVWAIDAKKPDMHFTTYDCDVSFWLPFNDAVGLHDASWRSEAEYAAATSGYYLTSGSHGCVNTPYDAMAVVFDTMEIGDPVIVYYSADQPVGPAPTQGLDAG